MPAHQLTPRPPGRGGPLRLDQAVLAVLAGTPASDAAALAGTSIDILDEAVETFTAAGTDALAAASRTWIHVSAEFPRWEDAETSAITALSPALNQLVHDGAITNWWFLRKYPCWRLRMRPAEPAARATVAAALAALARSGVLSRWRPGIYEPETAAFGGSPGISIAHDLHAADSTHTIGYLAQPCPPMGRREMSMLLCTVLFHAAGLDSFEQGDTWHHIAQIRPGQHTARPGAVSKLRSLLTSPLTEQAQLFSPGHPAAPAAPWGHSVRRRRAPPQAASQPRHPGPRPAQHPGPHHHLPLEPTRPQRQHAKRSRERSCPRPSRGHQPGSPIMTPAPALQALRAGFHTIVEGT